MNPEMSIVPGLDDARLLEIANEFGTPLIVYSEEMLRLSASNLRNALPEDSELAYSIKANPSPYILRVLRHVGLLAEAASVGEFDHAIGNGFPASRLLLGGPAMSDSALLAVKQHQPVALLLESEHAIMKASAFEVNEVPVLLRVNPVGLQSDAQTRMTGMASPFGIDQNQLPEAIALAIRLGLNYAGLSMYVGTQVHGAQAIATNTLHLLRLNENIENSGLPRSRILNFGGGFPTPEKAEQPELDLAVLRMEFDRIGPFHQYASAERFLFESGRYLVNDAALLLTQVVDTKVSFGKRFGIMDTGINSLGLRQLKYRTHPPDLRVLGTEGGLQETSLCGPTCTPIDIIAEDVLLPPITPGCIICIPRFGAYSVCFSPTTLCGQGYPAEVSVSCSGEAHLSRKPSAQPAGLY